MTFRSFPTQHCLLNTQRENTTTITSGNQKNFGTQTERRKKKIKKKDTNVCATAQNHISCLQKQMKTKRQHPNDKACHTLPALNHSTSVCQSPDTTQALGLSCQKLPLPAVTALPPQLLSDCHKSALGAQRQLWKCFTPSHLLWAPHNGLLALLSPWKCSQRCHAPNTTFWCSCKATEALTDSEEAAGLCRGS